MTSPGTLRILFVCTANVSRSPYAHHRMRHVFGDQVGVASAGIPGTEGRQMDPSMEAALPWVDRPVLEHRSRILDTRIVTESDLVLTMEFTHHMSVAEHWPEASHKIFGLRQFVAGVAGLQSTASPFEKVALAQPRIAPNSVMLDIDDPYRRGRAVARRCARQLDDLILRLGIGLGYEPIAQD